MSVKISAIIPVYNCEKYLGKTLDSCLAQNISDFEIICVNDGSTDNSLDILREYENKDSRIKVLDQENAGAGSARNKALDIAEGEFVAFIDADDWYPDNGVWSFLYTKAKENNVKAAGGTVEDYHAGGTVKLLPDEYNELFARNGVVDYSEFQYDYGYTAYIFNREMIEEHNIRFPCFRRFQDPPFFVKALYFSERFFLTDRITYCYRRENAPKSISSEKLHHALMGIEENMIFSKEHGLNKLYQKSVEHINEFGYSTYYKIIEGDNELYARLMKLNSAVDCEMMGCKEGEYLLWPLKLLASTALRYETLRNNKLTRIMSAVPRRMIERKLEKEGK